MFFLERSLLKITGIHNKYYFCEHVVSLTVIYILYICVCVCECVTRNVNIWKMMIISNNKKNTYYFLCIA